MNKLEIKETLEKLELNEKELNNTDEDLLFFKEQMIVFMQTNNIKELKIDDEMIITLEEE